jgi:hypothetical protein
VSSRWPPRKAQTPGLGGFQGMSLAYWRSMWSAIALWLMPFAVSLVVLLIVYWARRF